MTSEPIRRDVPSKVPNHQLPPDASYSEVVRNMAAPTDGAIARLQDHRVVSIQHAAIGMATEAGEMLDQLKRYTYYGTELDEVNLIEECGDCLWYIQLALNTMGVTLEDCIARNVAKLKKRYPDKFDARKARSSYHAGPGNPVDPPGADGREAGGAPRQEHGQGPEDVGHATPGLPGVHGKASGRGGLETPAILLEAEIGAGCIHPSRREDAKRGRISK